MPLFVAEPASVGASSDPGSARSSFLRASLLALHDSLRDRGSYLVVRCGDPVEIVSAVYREVGARAVFAHDDATPDAAALLRAVGGQVNLVTEPGVLIHGPDEVLKSDGTPYTVFTPYSRAWRARTLPTRADILPAPTAIPTVPGLPTDLAWDTERRATLPDWPAGDDEARGRLAAFCQDGGGLNRYADDRDRLDLNGTSRLSPYLSLGLISPREAVAAALDQARSADEPEGRRGPDTWLREIVWREFCYSISRHFPWAAEGGYRGKLRQIRWRNDPREFAAWQEGRTGYPVVDAAMRQLGSTGWIHNRARMVAASFLVKDLLIDWRLGEDHFARLLVDWDQAINNGNWQWIAGVGLDAAPYFRVLNPVLQARRFDPNGAYIREWVPELASTPSEHIAAPWLMPEDLQRQVGCVIGVDYPAPIVDHAPARARAIAAYRAGVR